MVFDVAVSWYPVGTGVGYFSCLAQQLAVVIQTMSDVTVCTCVFTPSML